MERETTTALLAGSTGFTGRAAADLNVDDTGIALRLLVRRGSKSVDVFADDERVVSAAFDEPASLDDAMRGCASVIQCIGTIRAKFDAVTSYESVDYGTTIALLDAAKRTSVEHFVLLSSVGAGAAVGSYLEWKRKTEVAVEESGVPYTIVRPGYIAGDDVRTERAKVSWMQGFFAGLSDTPLGRPFEALRPVPVTLLARTLVHLAAIGPQNGIWSGPQIFSAARKHGWLPGAIDFGDQ